jgi:hypothetical protein
MWFGKVCVDHGMVTLMKLVVEEEQTTMTPIFLNLTRLIIVNIMRTGCLEKNKGERSVWHLDPTIKPAAVKVEECVFIEGL